MEFHLEEKTRLVVPKIDTLVQILWTPTVFITEGNFKKNYITAEGMFGSVTYSPNIRQNPMFKDALRQDGRFITEELKNVFEDSNRDSLLGAFKVHDA